MDYKVYNIFEVEDFNKLMKGVKVAKCMATNYMESTTKDQESQDVSKLEDLSISEKLFCSYCKIHFEDQAQQRLHYKLDWHRYNLKQNLGGLKSITEEKFTQLADDVSSISGSDSESDTEDEEAEGSPKNKEEEMQEKEINQRKYEQLRLLATRHAKVFFENSDGQILSLYRCLLHGKKDMPENDEQLVPLALKTTENPTWAIIMLGGGHFAAGIFQGKEVLVHKTFHCYTVRARQGGTQSSRDGRSGGSHPKSAGASLRRYNEAALIQHVQEIMDSWSSQLSNCSLILYRAVGHNKNVLFSGKTPPLNKTDSRLRTIPFVTRRATFSEVKRVHGILANLEMYGSADSFKTDIPQTPRKKNKSQMSEESSTSGSNIDVTIDQGKNIQLSSTEASTQAGSESDNKNEDKTTGSPAGKSPKTGCKPVIDRAKPRKSPHRPLPDIVNAILSRSSSESDMSEHRYELGGNLIGEDMELSFEGLQEFEDTVPLEMKRRMRDKRTAKKKQVVKDAFSTPIMALRTKLWAACKMGDIELLVNSLQTAQPIIEEPEHAVSETDATSHASGNQTNENVITRIEYLKCLNENVGENKETLLHVAAQSGHLNMIRTLMEAGCDPSVKNKKSQTPYVVCANKESRNIFRRFLAEFPDKYDYTKSQISGPLTEDMEQKLAEKRKEQKKAKRGREKERKKVEEARKEEESEKERFLQLSDREKRALAAERRLVSQSSGAGAKQVLSRCFQCAVDITGKVPFEYDIHRFCSIDCLKQHRLKLKNTQQKQ